MLAQVELHVPLAAEKSSLHLEVYPPEILLADHPLFLQCVQQPPLGAHLQDPFGLPRQARGAQPLCLLAAGRARPGPGLCIVPAARDDPLVDQGPDIALRDGLLDLLQAAGVEPHLPQGAFHQCGGIAPLAGEHHGYILLVNVFSYSFFRAFSSSSTFWASSSPPCPASSGDPAAFGGSAAVAGPCLPPPFVFSFAGFC